MVKISGWENSSGTICCKRAVQYFDFWQASGACQRDELRDNDMEEVMSWSRGEEKQRKEHIWQGRPKGQ